jgi:hypothetical protein
VRSRRWPEQLPCSLREELAAQISGVERHLISSQPNGSTGYRRENR